MQLQKIHVLAQSLRALVHEHKTRFEHKGRKAEQLSQKAMSDIWGVFVAINSSPFFPIYSGFPFAALNVVSLQ